MSYNTGNIVKASVISVTLSPAAVLLQSTTEQTFTVNGLQVGDWVGVSKPTNQAGLAITNARVSAANTLAISFGNLTAINITPTPSQVYSVMVVRPDATITDGNI